MLAAAAEVANTEAVLTELIRPTAEATVAEAEAPTIVVTAQSISYLANYAIRIGTDAACWQLTSPIILLVIVA